VLQVALVEMPTPLKPSKVAVDTTKSTKALRS